MSERNISTEIKAATEADIVAPIFFINGVFPSGEVWIWSGEGTIVWGGQNWEGLGSLLELDIAPETLDGSAQGSSVTLSGIDSSIFDDALLGDYQGGRAKIYFGVFNTETMELEGDPYLMFSGLLDSDEIEDDGEKVKLKVNIEHRLSDLLRRRQYRYTDQDQQELHPNEGDKGLQYVASMVDVKLKWGRA